MGPSTGNGTGQRSPGQDLDGADRGSEDPAAEALYAQVRSLLARTSELSARSEGLLAREQ